MGYDQCLFIWCYLLDILIIYCCIGRNLYELIMRGGFTGRAGAPVVRKKGKRMA